MIHLFEEANEDTCSHKNPYEEDYHTALYAFYEVYGHNGEKLKGNEKVETSEGADGKPEKAYSPIKPYWFEELNEENKRISELYRAEERQIYEYRDECKTKALSMFVEYFDSLWD